MRIEQRHIALVTVNCPTHPNPLRPPNNYSASPPPVLTNVTLIYLSPNTTTSESRLQPLDQGIIKAFKAAYRRRYADNLNMVQLINQIGVAPQLLDIRQAIQQEFAGRTTKIKNALSMINYSTLSRSSAPIVGSPCAKSLIHNQVFRLQIQIGSRNFTFDEDKPKVLNEYQLTTTFPGPVQTVQAGVASGILLRGPSQFDNNTEMDGDLVLNHSSAVGENPLESPIATIDERYIMQMSFPDTFNLKH